MTTKPRFWLFLVVMALAGALRFAHLRELEQRWPLHNAAYGDSVMYLDIARQVIAGTEWQGPAYLQAPGYGYFCAAVHLVGHGLSELGWTWPQRNPLDAVRYLQALLGAVGAGTLYGLTARLFGQSAGILAGIAGAAYAPWIAFDAELLPASSLVACVMAALYLAQYVATHEATWSSRVGPLLAWAALGLLLGCGALVRMNLLPFAALLVLWGWSIHRHRDRPTLILLALIFTASFAAPLTLVAARNYVVSRHFQVVLGGAPNFWLANNPDWLVTNEMRPSSQWTGGYNRPGIHPDVDPAAWADWYRQQSLQWIRERPAEFLWGLVIKGRRWLGGHERRRSIDLYVLRDASNVLAALVWHPRGGLAFPTALLLPLAVLGLVWGWHRQPTLQIPLLLFIIVYFGSIFPFPPAARYRLPLMVALLPYAALAIVEFVRRGRTGWPAWIGITLLTTLASIEHDGPAGPYQSELRLRLGDILVEQLLDRPRPANEAQAMAGRAESLYREALAFWPDGVHPRSRLAELALMRGQVAQAEQLYAEAARANPHDWVPPYTRGQLLVDRGAWREALLDFHRAARCRDDLAFIHERIAACWFALGELERARSAAREALRRDPAQPGAAELHRLAARFQRALRELLPLGIISWLRSRHALQPEPR